MKNNWTDIITDDNKRHRTQYICIFLLLGFVAAFMTILNIFTHKGALTVVTGVFCALCLVNFAIVKWSRNQSTGMQIASMLFMAEIVLMFTFFIISGNPDGFSAIWIAMLPACGMLVFGRRRTTILCAILFVILAFFFWTEPGRAFLRYEYNPTFMMRFPILYAAFFSLSFLLETIRSATQRELDRLRDEYKYLSAHDYLTNLINRQGLEDWRQSTEVGPEQAVFMLDIDHFKNVNDSFGHDVGDIVLAGVAEETAKVVNTPVCRWGGEEFVVWFPDSSQMADPERIRRAIEAMVVKVPHCNKKVRVTISIGVAKGSGELKDLITAADEALYKAKQSGRNRVEWTECK